MEYWINGLLMDILRNQNLEPWTWNLEPETRYPDSLSRL